MSTDAAAANGANGANGADADAQVLHKDVTSFQEQVRGPDESGSIHGH